MDAGTRTGRLVSQAGELRVARVESLRALAVVGVLVAHALYWSVQPPSASVPVERILVLTTQACPFVLFVLSGCLLYGPFARRDLGTGGPLTLRRYGLNRAVRILPVYYAALAIGLLLRGGATPAEWALYATFTQNLVVAPNDQVNRVMWFMAIEVHFYLALPLVAYVVGRIARRSRRRAALVVAVLGTASFWLFAYAWHADPEPRSALQFSLPSTFFLLATGMLLAILRLQWEERPPTWLRRAWATSDAWVLAALALLAVLVAAKLQIPATGAMVVITAVSALLVGACVLPLRTGLLVRLLDARPLALAGIASYSLLLCHDPILAVLTTSGAAPGWRELVAIGLPLSLLAAAAGYTLVEAPFLRLRRRWTRSDRPATPVPVHQGGTR